jgi:hypothetical protein
LYAAVGHQRIGKRGFLWVVVGLAAVMAVFGIVISRRRRSGK